MSTHRIVHLEQTQLEGLCERPSGSDNRILRERYRRFLRQSILMLPEKEQLVMRLHHLKGIPCTKIASLLQIHRSTVTRRLAAAHRKLQLMAQVCQKSGLFESPSEEDSPYG